MLRRRDVLDKPRSVPGLGLSIVWDDGGRTAAGIRWVPGDCVTRAIAIATNIPYREVRDGLNQLAKLEVPHPRKRKEVSRDALYFGGPYGKVRSNASVGVGSGTYTKYLTDRGWIYVSGRMKWQDIPLQGTYLAMTPHHLGAIVNGMARDTYWPFGMILLGFFRQRVKVFPQVQRQAPWQEIYREQLIVKQQAHLWY